MSRKRRKPEKIVAKLRRLGCRRLSVWPRDALPSGLNRYGQDHGRDNKKRCRADYAAQAPD